MELLKSQDIFKIVEAMVEKGLSATAGEASTAKASAAKAAASPKKVKDAVVNKDPEVAISDSEYSSYSYSGDSEESGGCPGAHFTHPLIIGDKSPPWAQYSRGLCSVFNNPPTLPEMALILAPRTGLPKDDGDE